jgi:hypothetical protein
MYIHTYIHTYYVRILMLPMQWRRAQEIESVSLIMPTNCWLKWCDSCKKFLNPSTALTGDVNIGLPSILMQYVIGIYVPRLCKMTCVQLKNETVCTYMVFPSMYIKVRYIIGRLCISKCVLLKMKQYVPTWRFPLCILKWGL